MTENIDPRNNICVVLTHKDGSKEWLYGKNTVTNDGDIYYAKKAVGGTPSSNENFFASACVLQNPSSADSIAKADTYVSVSNPIVTSGAVQGTASGSYPKQDDTGNSENTGAAVDAVTYKFAWTTAQINTSAGNAITGGAIYDVGQSSPVNATKLLTHWNFTSPASFHKTNTDTLTLYVNHTMNGT